MTGLIESTIELAPPRPYPGVHRHPLKNDKGRELSEKHSDASRVASGIVELCTLASRPIRKRVDRREPSTYIPPDLKQGNE